MTESSGDLATRQDGTLSLDRIYTEAAHMAIQASAPNREQAAFETRIIGRMEFGSGAIDGADCSEQSFGETLKFIAEDGLTSIDQINNELRAKGQEPVRNMFEIPSNCMDGRANWLTLAGEKVAIARPKVVGGAPLFLTNVFSVAGLLADPKMIDRFSRMASMYPRAAAMHEACGMAGKGSTPVLAKYLASFDEIQEATADLTQGRMRASQEQKDRIRQGIEETIEVASAQLETYNEANMIDVVREISGDNAVLRYKVDESHPTHSHEEKGLAYLFSTEDLIMMKDAVNANTDLPDVFYHNATYAKRLVKGGVGLLHSEDLAIAQIVGMQLPMAANSTLGANQWLGSIGDYTAMDARLTTA